MPIETWRYVVPRDKNYDGWGVFLVASNGMLAVVSDYGNYAYHWSNWGTSDFREFLTQLDSGYLMGKFCQGRKKEYNGVETRKFIQQQILDMRKTGALTAEVARSEYDLADKVEDGEWAYHQWADETEALDVYGGDPPGHYDHGSDARYFYDKVYVRFIDVLNEALLEKGRESVQQAG